MPDPEDDPSKKRWRTGRFAFRLFLSASVLWIVFQQIGQDDVLAAWRTVPLGGWSATLLAFVALHVLSAFKWRLYVNLADGGLARLEACRCYFAGLFANLCLPSLIGGDVLRAGLAMRTTRSRASVVVAALADRLVDMSVLCGLAALGFLLTPTVEERPESLNAGLVLGLAATVIVIGMVGTWVALHAFPFRRWPRKVRRIHVRLLRALRALLARPARALLGVLLAFAIQAGFVLVNARLGALVGLEMPLVLWFFLWPLAKIAAMLPISLGGLGVREAAFAGLVAPFGMAASLAVAQSLLWQSVLIVGGLCGGAFFAVTRRTSA